MPKTTADLNGDNAQNGLDLFAFSKAWSTTPADANYNEAADFQEDDLIDWNDLLLFNYRLGLTNDPDYSNPLAQPVLSSPPDQAAFTFQQVNSGNVRLEWGAVPGAQVYLVNIQGQLNFVLPVSAPTTHETFPTNVSYLGNYRWFVTATAPGIGDPWIKVAAPARVSSQPSAERVIAITSSQ